MRLKRTEDDEAIAFVQEFALRWPHLVSKLIHIPNEGGLRSADGSHFGKLAKRRKMGVTPGVSDYLLRGSRDRRPLWLELKADGGTLKPDQLAFLRDVVADGDAGMVAWTAIGAIWAVGVHLLMDRQTVAKTMDDVLAFNSNEYGFIDEFTMGGKLRQRAANARQPAKEA
jgi:hypothetical protein